MTRIDIISGFLGAGKTTLIKKLLGDALKGQQVVLIENEFGDLFFSLVNAGRLYKINPENALERTNQKFIRRFNYLEQATIQKGIDLKSMTLAEMDAIWDEAKKKGL